MRELTIAPSDLEDNEINAEFARMVKNVHTGSTYPSWIATRRAFGSHRRLFFEQDPQLLCRTSAQSSDPMRARCLGFRLEPILLQRRNLLTSLDSATIGLNEAFYGCGIKCTY